MTTWEPVPKDEAQSIVGEGVHTGLRKGTDAPESGKLWNAINDSDRGWSEALSFFVWGLYDVMDMALCKKVEEQPAGPSIFDLDEGGAEQKALLRVSASAGMQLVQGEGDELVVLPNDCPEIPGEQGDDGIRAVAVIDILRFLVDQYEEAM